VVVVSGAMVVVGAWVVESPTVVVEDAVVAVFACIEVVVVVGSSLESPPPHPAVATIASEMSSRPNFLMLSLPSPGFKATQIANGDPGATGH